MANTYKYLPQPQILYGSDATPMQPDIYQPYIHQAYSGEKVGKKLSFLATARQVSLLLG